MGKGDKVGNKADKAAGMFKEGAGKATDDESLEREGQTDQAKADVKQAAEKMKDALKSKD
jgi:uncharacterized protein YjbJ (UPF0337 family)